MANKNLAGYFWYAVGEIALVVLGPVSGQIQNLIDRSKALASYMQGRTLEEISNIDLYIQVVEPSYRPFEWNRAALEQLKSSGALEARTEHEIPVHRMSVFGQRHDGDFHAAVQLPA